MVRSAADEILALPHWARVVFAARCARSMMPLFQQFWPDAKAERTESMQVAIQVVEQSAANGKVTSQMKDKMTELRIKVVATAGAALRPVYGFPGDEIVPPNETACHIASFAAKTTEWAIKSAQDSSTASADAALEAYTWARQSTQTANASDVLKQLQTDLARLRRVAIRGKWTDKTPVPADVFDLLADASAKRPWWSPW